MSTKPFPSYNGGKESDGTFQKIISIMPQHDIYIEPFIGNGAILRRKLPAHISSIAIDRDASVIAKWLKSGYGTGESYYSGCNFICSDAIPWLKNFRISSSLLKQAGRSVLIYCDPPYPKDVRKSETDLYKFEFDLQDHKDFLNAVCRIDAMVVVSSYPNQLYEKYLEAWNTFTFSSVTRSGPAVEQIWFNFPLPDQLHDYRYIGSDFRDRAKIKLLAGRTVARFSRMRPGIRNMILDQLKTKFDAGIR